MAQPKCGISQARYFVVWPPGARVRSLDKGILNPIARKLFLYPLLVLLCSPSSLISLVIDTSYALVVISM
jgi:hypothetical protein